MDDQSANSAGSTPSDAQTRQPTIQVTPVGARPSALGAAELFTGTVVVDGMFGPNSHSMGSGALVTFTPGARTAWHAHPVGQILIVTAGQGWIQAWGEERRALHPGDVAWIPPGVKHWHGASATHSMAHIAIQELRDGTAAQWMEHVNDGQYAA
ncbi:cupin domain-containing protein [Ralstonia chuxiongensis]|uniref:Cupin domain-containing protein n=1 Tax=Ralstonia chuxiongensis TaxID=2957504 RepID=A0AA42BJQ5_9RALS|nr:cupin domain-containing protein [Ralstonia chuxiongensis]MCP1175516.1 cupin domain-containing protein [Ralstonia chuxiongensis]